MTIEISRDSGLAQLVVEDTGPGFGEIPAGNGARLAHHSPEPGHLQGQDQLRACPARRSACQFLAPSSWRPEPAERGST